MKQKLTEKDYKDMRQLYYSGVLIKDIAKEKGVSEGYARNVISGLMGNVRRYTEQKRGPGPAGRITKEMLVETKKQLQIGEKVFVDTVEEEGGYTKKRTRRCKVLEKYKHIFTVQLGKQVVAFKYVDLLIKDSGVRFDRRKACKEGKNC